MILTYIIYIYITISFSDRDPQGLKFCDKSGGDRAASWGSMGYNLEDGPFIAAIYIDRLEGVENQKRSLRGLTNDQTMVMHHWTLNHQVRMEPILQE